MVHYVGLDVSSKETAYCILDDQGVVTTEGFVETAPEAIIKILKEYPLELVGIETSSLSHWLVTELQKGGLPAICIDAKTMAALLSTQINKNDQKE